MNRKRRVSPLSLMSQTFAYRAFVVFFLASVVPLGLLAFLGRQYVLPELGSKEAVIGVQVAIVFTALLALLSFFVLAHATREATAEMAARNERLRILVAATQSLTDSGFVDAIAHETLASGAALCSAAAGLLLFEPGPRGAMRPAPRCFGNGAERILEARRDALGALAERMSRDRNGVLLDEQSPSAADLVGKVEGFGTVGSLVAAPLLAQERSIGVLACFRRGEDGPFGQADLDLLSSLARQAGIAIENARLTESEKNFFTHVTELLVEAVDRFAIHQPGHSRRVAQYSVAVGRELGFEPARRERLFFAALLHDIGMLRIADLGVTGQEHYREHPRLGHDMIRPITLWSDLAPMVLHHHERFDGKGYPGGLKGEEIPFEARIIGLVEAFDAMTNRCSYRASRPVAEVMREIGELAGAQFDPAAAAALTTLVERGEIQVGDS